MRYSAGKKRQKSAKPKKKKAKQSKKAVAIPDIDYYTSAELKDMDIEDLTMLYKNTQNAYVDIRNKVGKK